MYGLDLVDILLPTLILWGRLIIEFDAVVYASLVYAAPTLMLRSSAVRPCYSISTEFLTLWSSGTYGGLFCFLLTFCQSTPSKNLCCMMSRISSRTFGSATRIFLTMSLVTGVRFFGNTMRPELTISMIYCGGIDDTPAVMLPESKPPLSWATAISIAFGPNGVNPPSSSQIRIPKLQMSAL